MAWCLFKPAAQKTVTGLLPENALRIQAEKRPFKPAENNHKYRIGEDQQKSLGSINRKVPFLGHYQISEDVDVVTANVPLLINLDLVKNREILR